MSQWNKRLRRAIRRAERRRAARAVRPDPSASILLNDAADFAAGALPAAAPAGLARTGLAPTLATPSNATLLAAVPHTGLVAGIQRGGAISVFADDRIHTARYEAGPDDPDTLAVGDHVHLSLDRAGRCTIVGVEPRRTKLARIREDRTRRSAFGRLEAVLAANVDVVVIVAAVAQPAFHPALVDRFLVIAQYGGIQPVLCLNKCDLAATPPDLTVYERLGLPIVQTSAVTGAGIEPLRQLLHGKLAVFSGHSGVGKSSLVNALAGGARQKVGAIRVHDGRGRHTTTSSTLLMLDEAGSYVIDTPGIRSLSLWKVDARTLRLYFPEIERAGARCRFADCSHLHEPACAVRTAVEGAEIPRQRYESYARMMSG